MAKAIKYEKKTTVKLSTIRLLNTDEMTINVNGEDIKLSTLFKDFNGLEIEIAMGTKQSEDLELKSKDESEDGDE